jgi:hypothetical protein
MKLLREDGYMTVTGVTLMPANAFARGWLVPDHARLEKMNNVTSAYQEAVSSLIKLQSECENSLPPQKFDGMNRILNDVQRRLGKIEPMLMDS